MICHSNVKRNYHSLSRAIQETHILIIDFFHVNLLYNTCQYMLQSKNISEYMPMIQFATSKLHYWHVFWNIFFRILTTYLEMEEINILVLPFRENFMKSVLHSCGKRDNNVMSNHSLLPGSRHSDHSTIALLSAFYITIVIYII